MQNVPLVWKFCEFAVKFMCTIHTSIACHSNTLVTFSCSQHLEWFSNLFPIISFLVAYPELKIIQKYTFILYCRWSDLWYLHDYTVFVSIIPGIKSKWLNCHKNIMSVTAQCLKRNVKNLFSNCTKLICPFQYLEVGS